MEEKEQLLSAIESHQEGEKNLSFTLMLWMMILLLGSVVLLAPKIYIRSNIYYASKNILQLQNQSDSLIEENKHLKKQLEDTKFKFLIMDIGF
jgi:Tfp pilus assembly protein PilN